MNVEFPTDEDRRQLEAQGIPLQEALRQLQIFRRPPGYVTLERACTVGDGIERIPEEQATRLTRFHSEAAGDGRLTKFVPASGAASRMFKHLLYFQAGPGRELSWTTIERLAEADQPEAVALVEFLSHVEELPFAGALQSALFKRGENLGGLARVGAFQPILDALLDGNGLNLDRRPKGLIEFHRYADGARTAFEEHLTEASEQIRDVAGVCRLHLTVSPGHRDEFDRRFDQVGSAYAARPGDRFEIEYSEQHAHTDTLAVDEDGEPIRDAQGRLTLRPGGHGSLIENLFAAKADLILLKNIDNVQPDRTKPSTLLWKRILVGYLVELQRELFDHLTRLRAPEPRRSVIDAAEEFVARRLRVEIDPRREPPSFQARRACLISRLNRPLRVCGVVPNTGEPGGGPFWVRHPDGTVDLQIVESAQVAPDDGGQQKTLRSATHFNPVDLVCAVRDVDGAPFDLRRFVDESAVIVTRKSEGGRELWALERPGLWNGAMAGWNTVFVEVPLETFSPVKTFADLLRPEHRP